MTGIRYPNKNTAHRKREPRTPEQIAAAKARRAYQEKKAAESKQLLALRNKLNGYSLTGDRVPVTLPTLRFMRDLPADFLR